MTDAVFNSQSEPVAIARLRELLDRAHRERPFDPDLGYFDALDERSETARSPVMIAMHMPLVTQIYESIWRPGWGRLMKGLGGPSMSEEYEIAADWLELQAGSVVLDLGCGPGNFTRRFARAVAPTGLAVGYDGSPPMLDRAVQDTPDSDAAHLAYVLGDASRLPFADAGFDAVCCFAALHMFPDPFGTLAECARLLRPGGRIALLTSHAPAGPRGAPARVAGPLSGQRIFARDELRDALESAGFTVEHQRVAGVTQLVAAARS